MIRLLLRCLAIVALASSGTSWAALASEMTSCTGKWPNFVTETCWSCLFPFNVGGVPIGPTGRDIPGDNGPAACKCPAPPPVYQRVGFTTNFWEPARIIEVVRGPGCLASAGALDLKIPGPEHTQQRSSATRKDGSFYHAHFYAAPLLYIMQLLVDSGCVQAQELDWVYGTEFDVAWDDDSLANIIRSPEVILTSSVPAQGSCAADCIQSSLLPNQALFHCSGCNGTMFPLSGHVQAHVGGVQASTLIAQRLVATMQREGIEWTHHSPAAICSPFLNPVIDKVAGKLQPLYPIPKAVPAPTCCNWMAENTILIGAGQEVPALENFIYLYWRKRTCCSF
jgi:conjugal transfer pilus assembly protein TraU